MTSNISVLQTPTFKRVTKKLKPNQRRDLNQAIRELINDPYLGEKKKGDLKELYVYKFKMVNQLTLLGYQYVENQLLLTLITLGSHENFYRDIQRR